MILRGREAWEEFDIYTPEEILASVSRAVPLEHFYGIYFLVRSPSEFIYVGMSINVGSRILQHLSDKDFDGWACHALPPCPSLWADPKARTLYTEKLQTLERIYIGALSPTVNKSGRTKSVLEYDLFRARRTSGERVA